MKCQWLLLAASAAALCMSPWARGEDLECLTDEQRIAAAYYDRLQEEAVAALARRTAEVEQLQTAEQIAARQKQLREFFVRQLGGFPERTPLNAKVAGVIAAEGYRIEKVIFESRPSHRVTANLYLPEGAGPFPGVIVSSGHSRAAKAADYNQRFGIILATHGMAALCYDPIGQGERSQALRASGEPEHAATTTEHFLVGTGSTLVGRNTASYRVWDAMRAIDYLASRPEIDAGRIGMTGCSGGGTLTSYTMALDDRVACAAPACYVTTFARLIASIGPQDAEQNIFGQAAFGMDHPDYILLHAPKPIMISATTGDFFDIRGTRAAYHESTGIYERLGASGRVALVESEGGHGVPPQNLAAIAQWMQKWLVGRDAPIPVAEIKTRPERELLCTERGQVLLLEGERSVFDLNAERYAELAAERSAWQQSFSRGELPAQIAEIIGARLMQAGRAPAWKDVGRVPRDGYHIDKLVLQPDAPVPLPALTFHPPEPSDEAYLYLHADGKRGDAAPGEAIEALVKQGYVVVSVDLRGQGETALSAGDPRSGDWKTAALVYLLGRSLVGARTEDAVAAGQFVAYYQKSKDNPRPVHLVASGSAGIVALHAAAVRPELFASITLRNSRPDWATAVRQPTPEVHMSSVVHGALRYYDLPDLVRIIGEDKVRFDPSE